jgi:hypothetical protein
LRRITWIALDNRAFHFYLFSPHVTGIAMPSGKTAFKFLAVTLAIGLVAVLVAARQYLRAPTPLNLTPVKPTQPASTPAIAPATQPDPENRVVDWWSGSKSGPPVSGPQLSQSIRSVWQSTKPGATQPSTQPSTQPIPESKSNNSDDFLFSSTQPQSPPSTKLDPIIIGGSYASAEF